MNTNCDNTWRPAPAAPIMSRFGEAVTPDNAWREYPRPQMARDAWQSLNGLWEYAIIPADADKPSAFDGEILVPFPPESALSGVGRKVTEKDQIWYRRTVDLDGDHPMRTLLHFESVDFRAQVFVNGEEATDVPHAGSSAPFTLDVTPFVRSGENLLEVCVWDPCCTHVGTTGKQMLDPIGSFHPAESGICGSVWLETVPETYLAGWTAETDIETGTVAFRLDVRGNLRAAAVGVTVSLRGNAVATATTDAPAVVPSSLAPPLVMRLPKPLALWSCRDPNLYDVEFAVSDSVSGSIDCVRGYFGMRDFGKAPDASGAMRFTLNGEPIYLLGVLDQGWWPDGLLTPPSEEAVRFDVDFLRSCGFNAIRKHIKVEPDAFYANCDRTGTLVVQDIPCGGGDYDNRFGNAVPRWGMFRRELRDVVDHLRNHPCIVMWAPFNEGWGQPGAEKTRQTYRWLRRHDPSRLLDGPSGWNDWQGGEVMARGDVSTHTAPPDDPAAQYADVLDCHDYPGPAMFDAGGPRVSFLGEFGALAADAGPEHTWHDQPRTIREAEKKTGKPFDGSGDPPGWQERLARRYAELNESLLPLVARGLGGSIYTQATDVGMECDGFITYDRRLAKFDPAFLRGVHERILTTFSKAVEGHSPQSTALGKSQTTQKETPE